LVCEQFALHTPAAADQPAKRSYGLAELRNIIMAQEQDFYGGTVSDAIANACKQLAASQEELNIEILETGSPGIFGLCRKKARIRVSHKEEKRTAVRKAPVAAETAVGETPPPVQEEKPPEQKKKRPSRGRKKPVLQQVAEAGDAVEESPKAAPPATASAQQYTPPSAEALEAVQKDIVTLLDLMGCPSTSTVELENQTVVCKISGEHQEILTGHDGRTLDSLQYLLRKITSKLLPDRTKLLLEVGNYREQRMEALKEQVIELAAKVREDGMTQAIPALNPSERRVVHMLLQEDKEVRSRSVGDGLFKKVLIYKPGRKKPARRGGKGRKKNDKPSED
jgi:spoIIIJ-associated protein